MKQVAVISAFAFLLSFSLAVNALSLTIPSDVTVRETETRFLAVIENNSSEERSLIVSFSAPADHRLKNVPATIKANSSATIEIVLLPNPELSGMVYASTLTAKLGDETKSRQINISFEGARKLEQQPTGFFALQFLEQNFLNIALILIAALLLIAFIARFTKRVSTK